VAPRARVTEGQLSWLLIFERPAAWEGAWAPLKDLHPMSDLGRLAELLRQKNDIDGAIAAIIGRPALIGHVGEFIAASVFGISLHLAATNVGCDGRFHAGSLAGRSVNVKWYGKHEGLLDLSLKSPPDFYLVLAGPRSGAVSSRGGTRPWLIRHVFLFEAKALHQALAARGVKLGTATSVAATLWQAAEVYPTARNATLRTTTAQREARALFQ